jgi:CRISPR/Cas system-associated endonuclease Cas1
MLLHFQDDEAVRISNKLVSFYTLYGIVTQTTNTVIQSYFLRTLLPAEQYITFCDGYGFIRCKTRFSAWKVKIFFVCR